MSTFTKTGLLALLLLSAACTVKSTEAPPLTGPSELGLRIALQAVPDSILQDGFSQTVINIESTNFDGTAVRGLPLRVAITVGGAIIDFGTLSAKTVVTGDDGRARVIYTSPPRPADPVEPENVVTIEVEPVGNDYRGEVRRTVDIRLVVPGVIEGPNAPPAAQFAFSPANPAILQTVTFDASTSTDEGVACPTCAFVWDFGDGSSATGVFTTHSYRAPGNYQIRLTVTDRRGAATTIAQSLTVGPGTPPTANFVFSPNNPAIGQAIFFNAESSTAASGRRIVSHDWDFGSGRFGSGVTTSKSYDTAGTYTVQLTVTDDAGLKATTTQQVTVGAQGTGPTASLTVSPASGTTSTNFNFDASASRPGPSPIIEYRFSFGDNTPDVVGTSPTTSHRYLLPGSYTARVTVRDSQGRTAQATATVSVAQ